METNDATQGPQDPDSSHIGTGVQDAIQVEHKDTSILERGGVGTDDNTHSSYWPYRNLDSHPIQPPSPHDDSGASRTDASAVGHDVKTVNSTSGMTAGQVEGVQAQVDPLVVSAQGVVQDAFASAAVAPINGEVGMEVDSASSEGDTDSTMGSDVQSSTVSLRESIFNYLEENGRTYHAYNSGKYNLPNDEAEQERLDLQHHLFSLTLDGALHIAPLPPSLHNVLDIGTGTGIWATEFAQEYPMARVIGTDLSPIQPLYVPPNCSFEVNDAEEPWDYTHPFDYIHGRALLSCFRDPSFIVHSAFHCLRPGGILELQDPQMPILCIDSSMDGTALQEWTTAVPLGAAALGRVVTNSKNYPRYMQEAGFVDIVEKHYYWPVNTWPRGKREKLVGLWTQQNLLDGIHAMSMAILTRGLGWTPEAVEMLLMGVRNNLKNRRIHGYVDVIVCYGRKPEPVHVSPTDSGHSSGGEGDL